MMDIDRAMDSKERKRVIKERRESSKLKGEYESLKFDRMAACWMATRFDFFRPFLFPNLKKGRQDYNKVIFYGKYPFLSLKKIK